MLLFMKRSRIDSGHHQANWMGTGGTGTTMWDRPKSRQHKYARRGTKGSMDVPCMINAHPTCCPIRSMDRWIEGRLEGSRSAGPKKEARGRVGDAAGLRRIPRLPRSSAIGLKDKQHTYECKRRTPNLQKQRTTTNVSDTWRFRLLLDLVGLQLAASAASRLRRLLPGHQ